MDTIKGHDDDIGHDLMAIVDNMRKLYAAVRWFIGAFVAVVCAAFTFGLYYENLESRLADVERKTAAQLEVQKSIQELSLSVKEVSGNVNTTREILNRVEDRLNKLEVNR